MIATLIILVLLSFLFWLGYRITGALLGAFIWLCIKLPAALFAAAAGVVLCVTIIFIPIGRKCLSFARRLLFG